MAVQQNPRPELNKANKYENGKQLFCIFALQIAIAKLYNRIQTSQNTQKLKKKTSNKTQLFTK